MAVFPLNLFLSYDREHPPGPRWPRHSHSFDGGQKAVLPLNFCLLTESIRLGLGGQEALTCLMVDRKLSSP